MNKLFLIALGLVFSLQAFAQQPVDGVYRPYAECASVDQDVTIYVNQNVDAKDLVRPYQALITRKMDGKEIQLPQQSAKMVPSHHKLIAEWIQGGSSTVVNGTPYAYNLMISTTETDDGFEANFSDNYGSRALVCSFIVTGL